MKKLSRIKIKSNINSPPHSGKKTMERSEFLSFLFPFFHSKNLYE